MKRLVALLLALVMILSFAACGKEKEAEHNAIASLYDQGLFCRGYVIEENRFKALFMYEDGFDKIYKVSADMSDAEYDAFNNIPWDDEHSEDKQKEIILSLKNVEITDITDKVPSQAELDQYVGKTLGELEDMGFMNTGNMYDDETVAFWYEGPEYEMKVLIDDSIGFTSFDDYSPNQMREFVVSEVEFQNISINIVE